MDKPLHVKARIVKYQDPSDITPYLIGLIASSELCHTHFKGEKITCIILSIYDTFRIHNLTWILASCKKHLFAL